MRFAKIASIRHEERLASLANLAVSGRENFIANGIVVHNCRCLLAPTRPPPAWTDDALATALERGAAGAPGFGGR